MVCALRTFSTPLWSKLLPHIFLNTRLRSLWPPVLGRPQPLSLSSVGEEGGEWVASDLSDSTHIPPLVCVSLSFCLTTQPPIFLVSLASSFGPASPPQPQLCWVGRGWWVGSLRPQWLNSHTPPCVCLSVFLSNHTTTNLSGLSGLQCWAGLTPSASALLG